MSMLTVDEITDIGLESGDKSAASIWQPSPENAPQCMAYEIAKSGAVMEMGYGGEAGGGKTDLTLGLAGTLFERSLVLRREYPQLHDVELRGDEIYPVQFVGGSKKYWEFNNKRISIASCQYEKDWKKYQGRSIGLLAFDEAAEFLESQVRNISGWIRSPKGKHTLLLLCFNPPTTPEGEWIIQRFAPWIAPDYPGKRAAPGEIRWFANIDDKEIEVDNGEPFDNNGNTVYPISRTFIPASRHDNPHLGEDYERRLDNLPEPLRTMVKEGDFTIGTKDDKWQAIPTLWVLQAMERWRNTPKPNLLLRAIGCDPSRGGNDETAIAKLYGSWVDEIIAYPGNEMADGPTVGDKVIEHMETNAPIFIDGIGIGSSAYDYLKRLPNVSVTAIINSEGSAETSANGIYGYKNIRAASYWKLREALDPASGQNICLPDNRKLRVDLCTPHYKVRSGKIVIEPKEDIVKRTGRSPDYGDAVVMAWHGCNQPEMGWTFELDDGWRG
jgi:hypothetical protein